LGKKYWARNIGQKILGFMYCFVLLKAQKIKKAKKIKKRIENLVREIQQQDSRSTIQINLRPIFFGRVAPEPYNLETSTKNTDFSKNTEHSKC